MNIHIYFADFFECTSESLDKYGAFNVSLISDLPLFIDPFLLFNSRKQEYKALHDQILRYVCFLRDKSTRGEIEEGLLQAWFMFPAIKQNWLGYSKSGNKGSGLGREFAVSLNRNLKTVFADFGIEKNKIASGSHIEKLCLIRDGVGRDNISDFTANLIHEYLLEYTQRFALQHLRSEMRKSFAVSKVSFNYQTESWQNGTYELPCFEGDYVLLSPKDMITKDETWINRSDLMHKFDQIADSIPNEQLRAQINNYFLSKLPKEPVKSDRELAVASVLESFPLILDYYIAEKEQTGDEAEASSRRKVMETRRRFVEQVTELTRILQAQTAFYEVRQFSNTHHESVARVEYLKDVIENKGGYRLFYVDGEPFRREEDLQIAFRFTWGASVSAVDREVNNGRGPADYSVSRGSLDKALVEFKLASNSHLERNLQKQAEIYEKASDATHPSLKVIMFFTALEETHVIDVLKKLKLTGNPNIILIDARADNKPSASKA